MRPSPLSRTRVLALAGAVFFLAPRVALAHLGLLRSTPADGAHVATAPRELRLTFTESVEGAMSRLRLIGPSGTEVSISLSPQPPDSTQVVVASIRGPLQAGLYRLEWRVVGKDGHPVRGTISYVVTVGATGLDDPNQAVSSPGNQIDATTASGAEEAPHHDPVSMPSGSSFGVESPGYVAIRALQFVALLVVIGAIAFAFVVLRLLGRTETDPSVVASMRTRAASVAQWAAVALLATAGLRLYAQSLAMHGRDEALNPALMAAMVIGTFWAWSWLIQVAGALVAIRGFAIARRGLKAGWTIAAIAVAGLAITPALSGHAAAVPRLTALAITTDTLHVIGAAGWLGSLLFVLAVGIPVAMRLGSERRGGAVARLVNAFSPTALLFAGLTALTGIFTAWLHIGFSSALWTSDYGRTLLIKLAVLSVVIATGAFNWRKVKPALGNDLGARRIQRSAAVELAVGIVVVIVTAVLVVTPPPMDMSGGVKPAVRTSPAGD